MPRSVPATRVRRVVRMETILTGRGPYTFLRNEPILLSRTFHCIARIYRNLCSLQRRLQMGSFWENEPNLKGYFRCFSSHLAAVWVPFEVDGGPMRAKGDCPVDRETLVGTQQVSLSVCVSRVMRLFASLRVTDKVRFLRYWHLADDVVSFALR